MATQVQWRRGTTAQIAVFTPAVGEVVVDTTLNTLSVGDGVTVGGHYLGLATGGIFNNATFTGTFIYSSSVISGTATSTATITGGTYVNPALTGASTVVAPALTDNSTRIPSTSWVRQEIQLTSPINMGLVTAFANG